MPAKTLAEKLYLRADERSAILNPPDGFLDLLPDGLALDATLSGEYDLIQAFFVKTADLDAQIDMLIAHLKPTGKLWLCYPKAQQLDTDMNRDTIRPTDARIQAVRQVSIDAVWSALMFKKQR